MPPTTWWTTSPVNPLNWGFIHAFGNLWTAFFGKDTPEYYTRKDMTKGIAAIPPAAVLIFRRRSDFISSAIRKITKRWANHAGFIKDIGLVVGINLRKTGPNKNIIGAVPSMGIDKGLF